MVCICLSSDRYIPSVREDVPDHGIIENTEEDIITVCVSSDLPAPLLEDLRVYLSVVDGYPMHENYSLFLGKLVTGHLQSRVLSGSLRFDKYAKKWRWLGLENKRM